MTEIFSGSLHTFIGAESGSGRIAGWIDGIKAYMKRGGLSVSDWIEDPERPSFSESIPDEAYQAMLLRSVSAYYGIPMLSMVPAGFRAENHPLMIKLNAEEGYLWLKAFISRFVIPSPDTFVYSTAIPGASGYVPACSSAAFSDALRRLRNEVWPYDDLTICSWSGSAEERAASHIEEGGEYPGEALARCGFSVVFRAFRFSLSGCVPLIISSPEKSPR